MRRCSAAAYRHRFMRNLHLHFSISECVTASETCLSRALSSRLLRPSSPRNPCVLFLCVCVYTHLHNQLTGSTLAHQQIAHVANGRNGHEHSLRHSGADPPHISRVMAARRSRVLSTCTSHVLASISVCARTLAKPSKLISTTLNVRSSNNCLN